MMWPNHRKEECCAKESSKTILYVIKFIIAIKYYELQIPIQCNFPTNNHSILIISFISVAKPMSSAYWIFHKIHETILTCKWFIRKSYNSFLASQYLWCDLIIAKRKCCAKGSSKTILSVVKTINSHQVLWPANTHSL